MSAMPAKMSIWAGEDFACIKIVGRANLHSSIDFKTLVNELRQRGCTCFMVELSECPLMDSTFLGMLAGFGLRFAEPERARPIELLNPNPRITGLLESLGVLHLFRLSHGPVALPTDASKRDHVPVEASRADLGEACIEAHETLMRINPANIPKFKDVAQFLAEDLKRS